MLHPHQIRPIPALKSVAPFKEENNLISATDRDEASVGNSSARIGRGILQVRECKNITALELIINSGMCQFGRISVLPNLAQLEINQHNGQSNSAYVCLVAASAQSTGPLLRIHSA